MSQDNYLQEIMMEKNKNLKEENNSLIQTNNELSEMVKIFQDNLSEILSENNEITKNRIDEIDEIIQLKLVKANATVQQKENKFKILEQQLEKLRNTEWSKSNESRNCLKLLSETRRRYDMFFTFNDNENTTIIDEIQRLNILIHNQDNIIKEMVKKNRKISYELNNTQVQINVIKHQTERKMRNMRF